MSRKTRQSRGRVGVTEEQGFNHKVFASTQLVQGLLSLNAIEALCDECVANKHVESALLRDAIVLYGSLFKYSEVGEGQRHKLDKDSYVPEEFDELHTRLLTYRDKLFAHFDLTLKRPERQMGKDGSVWWRVDNRGPLDFKSDIPQIKVLISHVVDKLANEIVSEHQQIQRSLTGRKKHQDISGVIHKARPY